MTFDFRVELLRELAEAELPFCPTTITRSTGKISDYQSEQYFFEKASAPELKKYFQEKYESG